MQQIKFDDVTALQARVSEEFGPFGGEVEVTQEMIDRFADLTGDRQWIHVDVERCRRESPFGGTIAHGFLTLSLAPLMNAKARDAGDWVIVGQGNVANYGSDKLRFLSPVPAGSKLHSRSRLAAVEATPKGTRVVREVAIHVAGQEKPALLYTMILLYQPPRKTA
ncbi:MAG TPA: MaoC family dehydratase [Myxococcota bacterium]|jgi:acyl dehydratase